MALRLGIPSDLTMSFVDEGTSLGKRFDGHSRAFSGVETAYSGPVTGYFVLDT